MKGRPRKLRSLRQLLIIFKGKDWIRLREIRKSLKQIDPDLKISKRTLIRYLNKHIAMGNLEKITETGNNRYRLSKKGGMVQLASIIQASLKMQTERYPDLQKGCVTLEIRKEKEFWGLLVVLKEDWRPVFGSRWKEEKWGKMVSRGIIHFIDECIQFKPAFVVKIPETALFFFKPPEALYESINSAVLSREYETETDVIIHAMNEWKALREKKKTVPISLEQFPCIKNAVNKRIFKTPKEAILEALKSMEVQMQSTNSNSSETA